MDIEESRVLLAFFRIKFSKIHVEMQESRLFGFASNQLIFKGLIETKFLSKLEVRNLSVFQDLEVQLFVLFLIDFY